MEGSDWTNKRFFVCLIAKEKEHISYYDMVLKMNANFKLIAKPSPDAVEIYDSLAERYRKLEQQLESKEQENGH